MKICYLANAASAHTQRWVKAMRDKGFIIDVISFDECSIEGINVYYVKPVKREANRLPSESKSLSYIVKYREVKEIIRSINPDIVHAHYATGYGMTGALCDFHPFVISTWGSDIFNAPRKNKILKSIVTHNLKKADYITATSVALSKETMKYTYKNVYNIPFGIDIDKFKKNGKADGGKVVIGIVKALEEIYGIRYAIEAFKTLCDKYENIELMVVGDGTQKEEMLTLCRDFNIEDKVSFIGKVPNDDVPKFLNMMDIFLMPSISESFGVAALEAEACELPVIASNTGGIPEVVIEGKTGFLAKPRDVNSIVQKLEILIKDKTLRERMGESGRQFVEDNYNWHDNVESMCNLYLDIVNSK